MPFIFNQLQFSGTRHLNKENAYGQRTTNQQNIKSTLKRIRLQINDFFAEMHGIGIFTVW